MHNWRVLSQNLATMLALPLGAKKPASQLLQSMRTSECTWLHSRGHTLSPSTIAAAPSQLHALRLQQLSGILRWLERRVLAPLIRRFFYVEVCVALLQPQQVLASLFANARRTQTTLVLLCRCL